MRPVPGTNRTGKDGHLYAYTCRYSTSPHNDEGMSDDEEVMRRWDGKSEVASKEGEVGGRANVIMQRNGVCEVEAHYWYKQYRNCSRETRTGR